jgi:hypothetical protein
MVRYSAASVNETKSAKVRPCDKAERPRKGDQVVLLPCRQRSPSADLELLMQRPCQTVADVVYADLAGWPAAAGGGSRQRRSACKAATAARRCRRSCCLLLCSARCSCGPSPPAAPEPAAIPPHRSVAMHSGSQRDPSSTQQAAVAPLRPPSPTCAPPPPVNQPGRRPRPARPLQEHQGDRICHPQDGAGQGQVLPPSRPRPQALHPVPPLHRLHRPHRAGQERGQHDAPGALARQVVRVPAQPAEQRGEQRRGGEGGQAAARAEGGLVSSAQPRVLVSRLAAPAQSVHSTIHRLIPPQPQPQSLPSKPQTRPRAWTSTRWSSPTSSATAPCRSAAAPTAPTAASTPS